MRVEWPPQKAQAGRIDTTDLDADELFLDAVDAVVLAALEQIGDEPEARFRFFRQPLAAAQEAAGGAEAEGTARGSRHRGRH